MPFKKPLRIGEKKGTEFKSPLTFEKILDSEGYDNLIAKKRPKTDKLKAFLQLLSLELLGIRSYITFLKTQNNLLRNRDGCGLIQSHDRAICYQTVTITPRFATIKTTRFEMYKTVN